MRRFVAAATSALLGLTGLAALAVVAPVASADTAPPSPTIPATVSADALPTVQANGVVWSQATVANTVYATGKFSKVRPAGSAAGKNETTRNNLLAYNITNGNLITTFNHSLNAQGMVVAASPDGTRVYVGGDFTTVDGTARGRIAAFDTATGALITTFAPAANGRVKAIAATNTTVYAGGTFTAVNGVSRSRIAAFSASNGALLSWAPTVDDVNVNAMVLAPSGNELIVGGGFTSMDGQSQKGLGALDPITGAVLPWAANQLVQDSGAGAGITSLRTDGHQVFGTGYVFGGDGNLEGTFAADPDTGVVNWVEDCHGDSYDTFTIGSVVYSLGHAHYCGNIGGFPQTDPWSFYRAIAFTTQATGTVSHNPIGGYADWGGNPDPTLLNWFPTLDIGKATGQNQAAWSATGNDSYLALGGEFPTVNGTAQQGLVRFAVRSVAPNKVGPRPAASLTPSVVSLRSGTARVAWQTTFDQDNQVLTYKVVRDGQTATPVYTTTDSSTFWQPSPLGFTDTGLALGSTHTYRIYVTDPLGNTNSGNAVTVTVGSGAASAYATDVVHDGASDFWRLGEPSGSTGYDWAGYNDLVEQSGVTHGASGAIVGDSNAASTFNGSATGSAATKTPAPGPDTFTEEAWFQTTSTSGGKILGYGTNATGDSSAYDRHIYLDDAGHVLFGVYNNNTSTLATPGTYNDGAWHQVVATLSPAGMVLYVDGKRISRNAGVTNGQAYTGYWRLGGDSLGGWPSQPTSESLAGNIDEVAIYPTALNLTQVQKHYTDGGGTLTVAPLPTDTYGKAVNADNPDLFWRLDDASGPTAADSSGGPNGTYSGGVSYHAPSTVTSAGTGVDLDGTDGLIVSTAQIDNPIRYSEELWFKTNTQSGGKLIGFGDTSSGESNAYDRHVYMLDTGQLEFGTWTGQENVVTTSDAYNDNAWHQVVATQGTDGMKLYVDGQQVGSDPQTAAQEYKGYWRVGGDRTWGGATSDFFAGTVDEVAVYPSALPAARVLAHYQAAAFQPAPPNQAPVASFSSTCTNLDCTFDGSNSSDQDGSVISYAWDFGDGLTGVGIAPHHLYGSANTYHVTLTVTDDDNAPSDPVVNTVSPTAAPPPPPPPTTLAKDTFSRTVTNGLGTADQGGPWTGVAPTANLSVSPGIASLRLPAKGNTTAANLLGVTGTNTETDVTLTTDKAATGTGTLAYIVGRRVSTNNEYHARLKIVGATVNLTLSRLSGNTTDVGIGPSVNLTGLNYVPGLKLRVRLQVAGTSPTTLRVKVWDASKTEPAAWQITATDTTAALQVAGAVGLRAYLSGTATNAPVVVRASDFQEVPAA